RRSQRLRAIPQRILASVGHLPQHGRRCSWPRRFPPRTKKQGAHLIAAKLMAGMSGGVIGTKLQYTRHEALPMPVMAAVFPSRRGMTREEQTRRGQRRPRAVRSLRPLAREAD